MYLLDTCTLLWLASGHERLTPVRECVARARGRLFVSAITALEIGMKSAKGKLELSLPAKEWYRRALRHHGVREIPVTGAIALRATALPRHHADPCDRVIIGTALEEDLTILTPDEHVAAYDVATIW